MESLRNRRFCGHFQKRGYSRKKDRNRFLSLLRFPFFFHFRERTLLFPMFARPGRAPSSPRLHVDGGSGGIGVVCACVVCYAPAPSSTFFFLSFFPALSLFEKEGGCAARRGAWLWSLFISRGLCACLLLARGARGALLPPLFLYYPPPPPTSNVSPFLRGLPSPQPLQRARRGSVWRNEKATTPTIGRPNAGLRCGGEEKRGRVILIGPRPPSCFVRRRCDWRKKIKAAAVLPKASVLLFLLSSRFLIPLAFQISFFLVSFAYLPGRTRLQISFHRRVVAVVLSLSSTLRQLSFGGAGAFLCLVFAVHTSPLFIRRSISIGSPSRIRARLGRFA